MKNLMILKAKYFGQQQMNTKCHQGKYQKKVKIKKIKFIVNKIKKEIEERKNDPKKIQPRKISTSRGINGSRGKQRKPSTPDHKERSKTRDPNLTHTLRKNNLGKSFDVMPKVKNNHNISTLGNNKKDKKDEKNKKEKEEKMKKEKEEKEKLKKEK